VKKPLLAARIQGVLALQPMTISQIAQCLSVSDRCIQEALATLGKRRVVRRRGWSGSGFRTAHLFELVRRKPINQMGGDV
jgi:predicted ArsR family transcriptional regulator